MRRRKALAALAAAVVLAVQPPAHGQTAATPDTQFDFANGLYSRGLYGSAADAYTAFLDLVPDDPRAATAMFRLGESYYGLERYAEAQQAYSTLLHRWPMGEKVDAARLRLGQCALARGQTAEAIAQMETLLTRTLPPAVRAAALYALGQAAYDQGDGPKATRAFEQLAKVQGESDLVPYAHYYLGYLRWQAGDTAGAQDHFADFAAQTGDAALRGEALVRAGETALVNSAAAAGTFFQQALETDLTPELRDAAIRGAAWAHYLQGNHAAALQTYAAWTARIAAPETRAEVRYVAGEAAFQTGDYARARRELEAVLADPAGGAVHGAVRLRLAWTQFLQEDYAACGKTAAAALAAGDAANREEVTYLVAAAKFGAGEHAAASRGLRAFADGFPQSPLRADAFYQLGMSERSLGRLAEARDAFEAAVKAGDVQARGARALFQAGEARFGLKDFTGAATQWERVVKDHAADPLAPDALFRLGLAQYRQEQFADMESSFTQFRGAHAEHPLALDAAYWLGWAQQRQEKYTAATESFGAVTRDRATQHYADALARQALCAYQAEQEGQAAILYVRYLREITDRPLPRDVLFWLGHYMRERGEWQTAQFVYQRAMVQHPTDDVIEAARFEMGRCFLAGGKLPEALGAFDRVIQDFPDGGYAIRAEGGRGQVLQAQHRYDDAIEAYTKVTRGNEGFAAAEATLRLGQCFEALGKLREAADRYLFVGIVYDAPDIAGEAYLSAGRCLEELGDVDQARTTYEEFVQRYPDDDQVAIARVRLEVLTPPAPVPAAGPPAPAAS